MISNKKYNRVYRNCWPELFSYDIRDMNISEENTRVSAVSMGDNLDFLPHIIFFVGRRHKLLQYIYMQQQLVLKNIYVFAVVFSLPYLVDSSLVNNSWYIM